MPDARLAEARGIIADVLGCHPQDVAAEARVGSLPQWDSIAHLSIVMTFEERLGRQLTSEEIVSLETVSSFAALFPAGEKAALST
jgi:acyl carrier protein